MAYSSPRQPKPFSTQTRSPYVASIGADGVPQRDTRSGSSSMVTTSSSTPPSGAPRPGGSL